MATTDEANGRKQFQYQRLGSMWQTPSMKQFALRHFEYTDWLKADLFSY